MTLAVVGAFVAVAVPLISPCSPTKLVGKRLQSLSVEHWLGTDNLGRDVVSRLFWGSRVVLLLAPTSVLLGIMIGAPLGLVSGYLGGTIDTVIMRVGTSSCHFQHCLSDYLMSRGLGRQAKVTPSVSELEELTFKGFYQSLRVVANHSGQIIAHG